MSLVSNLQAAFTAVGTAVKDAKSRANHTGSQLAATVSDFGAAVVASPVVTTTTNGVMIAADKDKLDTSWTVKHKTQGQSVTNSLVLVDDTVLQFPVTVAGTYSFRICVFFSSAVTNANIRFRHACTATTTTNVRITRRAIIPGGTAFSGIATDAAFSAADVTVVGASVNPGTIWLEGTFTTTGTTGIFAFRWAQNIAQTTATIVQPGSYIEYRRIA
jgi:hypothetical protein